MAGMIEKIAKTKMYICRVDKIVDGKEQYVESLCYGRMFEFTQTDLNLYGKTTSNSKILIAPMREIIDTTCKIRVDKKIYTITSVKKICDMKGTLLGYKVII